MTTLRRALMHSFFTVFASTLLVGVSGRLGADDSPSTLTTIEAKQPRQELVEEGQVRDGRGNQPASNDGLQIAESDDVAVTDASADSPTAPSPITFERDVRPILKAHCFHCHGEERELSGMLDLRLRRLIVAGGDSGPAVVPGRIDESLMLERMRDGDMPPEGVQVRPTEAEVDLIAAWIRQGAPTLRAEPEELSAGGWQLTEEEKAYWAFRPVVRPQPPEVANTQQVRSPMDQFLLARLESRGLQFSREADRRTLIRRATLDLHGLPPSPEEVERFVGDPAPDAYDRLIDRLLASPHYGERWGRHWLDVAGYADSEGAAVADAVRPNAYKYRDYVIGSLNGDKPFDQFVCEQLAGDEMTPRPYNNLAPGQAEMLLATGFLRMAPDGTGSGGGDPMAARNQVVADTINIVGTSILGLTVGCAQCHNHRYDPISQADYYRLRAVFEPALNCADWKAPQARRVSLYSDADRRRAAEVEREAKEVERQRSVRQQELIEAVFKRELAKLPEPMRPALRAARETPAKKRTPAQQQLLKKHPSVNVSASSLYLYDKKAADELKALAAKAAKVRGRKPKEEFLRALTEKPGQSPPETFVFFRGDHQQPTDRVLPGELVVLDQSSETRIPLDDPQIPTSGRRLAYARWLTSGRHPLTARVLVNRIWRHHFGRGIVGTPGDFGTLGLRPTHPELLDWLADELVRSGWSLKRMHRLMMTSTAYRQVARRNDALDRVDAQNQLVGRMSVRRLEAEVVRDRILSVAGVLNSRFGGPPVPVMADRVGQWVLGIENLNAGRPGPVIPLKGEQYRRSVYTQVRRSRPLSVLKAFDAPDMSPNCTDRTASTVAPQALMLMNGEFAHALAGLFAERVKREAGSEPGEQLQRAWTLAFGRPPREEERAAALGYLSHSPDTGDAKTSATDAALAALCHVLISSNEFLYTD